MMSYFGEHFWGEKNLGFDVLYHSMKHGQLATKELADFIRERATIEETYAKSMAKLSKMASNGTPLGTFAPLWEVFRISSDKLALCHMELTKKLYDLIKEVLRYGEEQGKAHKKSKEEAAGTLEAVQILHGVSQLLPKSRENYHSKCVEFERLKREATSQKEIDKAEIKTKKAAETLRRSVEKFNAARADFEQKMMDSALRFQGIEESHLRHLKSLISSYSHSVEDTHVQIGQVHEEFKQNVENISVEMLVKKFAENKGTGREKPGVLDFEEYSSTMAVQEGVKRTRSKPFRIPGLSRRERERSSVDSPDAESLTCPVVDEEGFTVRPDINQNNQNTEPENHFCSSSDSDFDDDEPRKFSIQIKPVQPRDESCDPEAAVAQLKATVGNLVLPPGTGGTVKRHSSRHLSAPNPVTGESEVSRGDVSGKLQRPLSASRAGSCAGKSRGDVQLAKALFGPPLEAAFELEDFPGSRSFGQASSPSPFSSSSPENVEDSGLDSPSRPALGPSPDSWAPRPGTPQTPPGLQVLPEEEQPVQRGEESLGGRPARPHQAGSLQEDRSAWTSLDGPQGAEPEVGGSSLSAPWASGTSVPRAGEDLVPALPDPASREGLAAPPRRARAKRPLASALTRSHGDLSRSLSPSLLGSSAPSGLSDRSFYMSAQTGLGISRGPSPVVLGSQDALPVATAFTEYVHAYFRGRDTHSCLAKVTGELTMSFPAGIVRVLSGNPPPPVLSFRLVHTGPVEQFQPVADLLFSDPSQTDPMAKDFWLNMATLTGHLQRQAEQSPAASYYNVVLLRYQFSRPGAGATPLQLSACWECGPALTQVSVEYSYCPGTAPLPAPLTNVQVLLPVEEPVTNVRLQPAASWNLEEKRLLWRLPDISEAGGSGRLSASWEPLYGPSTPSPVAAQFTSEGSTLSGVDVELVGSGYRMSLVKKRFATGEETGCLRREREPVSGTPFFLAALRCSQPPPPPSPPPLPRTAPFLAPGGCFQPLVFYAL
ncbi:F-BAR domain only protein 1 isoform X2 [Ornithorhynchus anatinus]|uniref:F-BAR domain only protein 1 isoform X2 n=1 Tax=Ornithorhynchus anatinus TaxID=9258 RepID=UPI0019D4502D|nr:F-BAR domain only protein 1 isoform X2 [Ornithorhynchus anatinus]